MLSRIADSLYWTSRQLERADVTARLVESHVLGMLEAEIRVSETAHWRPLLAIAGLEDLFAKTFPGEETTARRAIELLTARRENPGSVRSSLRLARENARVVRDRISDEMWECLNELWLRFDAELRRPLGVERAAALHRMVKREISRFHGIAVTTMMRGEPFGFYLLGLFLERADMTTRVLDVKVHADLGDDPRGGPRAGTALDYYQWAGLLQTLSGFDAFRRTRQGGLRPADVVAFLVYEPSFPRSLRFAVDRMEQALASIGTKEECVRAARALAALDRRLASSSPEKVLADGLHPFLADLLGEVRALHEAVQATWFDLRFDEASCGI